MEAERSGRGEEEEVEERETRHGGSDVDACVFLAYEHPTPTEPTTTTNIATITITTFSNTVERSAAIYLPSLRSFVPYKFTRSHALHPASLFLFLSLSATPRVSNGERTLR